MTIDLIVGETLDGKLADLRVPRTDLEEIRRVGRRRRNRRYGTAAAAVFLAAFGTTVALLANPEPEPASTPASVPAMDFAAGARGVYDSASGKTSLGGQSFELGDVMDLGTSAVATPYGLVFFGADQSTRLLPADGRVRTLAPAPARPESFTPTVRYDNQRYSVAWLTRSNGRVSVSVYSLVEPLRLIASYPVPCSSDCESLRMAGHDQGLVFVSGPEGTHVIDPSTGPDAQWSDVTDGKVVDVRSRVILSEEPEGASTTLPAPLDDGTWRLEPAQYDNSVLSYDGAWEVGQTTTWRFIGDDNRSPFVLTIPPGTGPVEFALDTDSGSVIVSRVQAGDDVYFDCDYFGHCVEFATFAGADGGSGIVGGVR